MSRCIESGCDRYPVYNDPNKNSRLYCSDHKKDGMVPAGQTRCVHPECKGVNDIPKYALFGFRNTGKKLYCKTHAWPGMENLKKKRCKECDIQPYYNNPGKTIGEYCNKHKKTGMINVYSKLCEYDGCNINASFNYPGEKRGKFCQTHCDQGMINVRAYKCTFSDCQLDASFNHQGEKQPLFCFNHKEQDMINVRVVFCKTCEQIATHGYPGNKVSHCRKCKLDGMIHNPIKICATKGCKETALYGYKFQIHCEKHKTDNEYNLVEKECIKCGLVEILNNENICLTCDPTSRTNRLMKQKQIKDFLDENGMIYASYDKQIDKGVCGKERPDFIFETDTHCVVLEVDEYQHASYDNICEKNRMINISQSLGIPTIFIRYNPDSYISTEKRKPGFVQRTKILLKVLLDCLSETELKGFASVVYLFYDNFNNKIDQKILLDKELNIV